MKESCGRDNMKNSSSSYIIKANKILMSFKVVINPPKTRSLFEESVTSFASTAK